MKSVLLALALVSDALPAAEIHLAQGLLAGEVSVDSVILQSRLAAVRSPSGGGLPGAPGTGRFEISEDATFKEARTTAWLRAGEEGDFILKARVDGLKPGILYHYRLIGGPEEQSAKPLGEGSFKTLPEITLFGYFSAEGLNSIGSMTDGSDNDHFGGKDAFLSRYNYDKAKGEIDTAAKKGLTSTPTRVAPSTP